MYEAVPGRIIIFMGSTATKGPAAEAGEGSGAGLAAATSEAIKKNSRKRFM